MRQFQKRNHNMIIFLTCAKAFLQVHYTLEWMHARVPGRHLRGTMRFLSWQGCMLERLEGTSVALGRASNREGYILGNFRSPENPPGGKGGKGAGPSGPPLPLPLNTRSRLAGLGENRMFPKQLGTCTLRHATGRFAKRDYRREYARK